MWSQSYSQSQVETALVSWNMGRLGNVNPLQLPPISRLIMHLMPQQELTSLRLVCKLWNSEAKRILHCPLRQVLKYLSVSELRECRMVCKAWDSVSRSILKYNLKIQFEDHERILMYVKEVQAHPELCTDAYFGKNIQLGNVNVQSFLNACGGSIRSLHLKRSKWNVPLFSLLFTQLPNLESLTVVCGIINATPERTRLISSDENPTAAVYLKRLILDMNVLDSRHQVRPHVDEFFSDLFKIAKNLEYFWWNVRGIYPRTWAWDKITSDDVCLHRLLELNTIIDLDQARLAHLMNRHFPLKRLYIRLNSDVSNLYTCLSSFANTLTTLAVAYNSNSTQKSSIALEFTSSKTLTHLAHLELHAFRGSMEFLDDFPQLEKLILVDIDCTKQFPFTVTNVYPEGSSLKYLSELTFISCKGSPCTNDFSKISQSRSFSLKNFYSLECWYYETPTEDQLWKELETDIFSFPVT